MPPHFVDIADLNDLIDLALREDVGPGDITSNATIRASTQASALFSAKEDGVVAGLELADMIFDNVDARLHISWNVQDGSRVAPGEEIGTVTGNARSILLAERVVLNFMQRMSGIATATRRMVDNVEGLGTDILDTRKTIPGLRALDKWAVLLGGGVNHRYGLHDMILIKDNHIASAGGAVQALRNAVDYRKSSGKDVKIEIEAKTLTQVAEIVDSGLADILMLDNMAVRADTGKLDTSMLEEALQIVDGRVRTEASGNVTLETVREIASTGVDSISSGALTHSVRALDISLNVVLND